MPGLTSGFPEWDESRPVVVLPMFGEFGWLIMTHVRFAHSLAASRKVVCCDTDQACLFPSTRDFFFDWKNPIDDDDRCGHGGYRHAETVAPNTTPSCSQGCQSFTRATSCFAHTILVTTARGT